MDNPNALPLVRPLLRAPFESLSKLVRNNQKLMEHEIKSVTTAVTKLKKGKTKEKNRPKPGAAMKAEVKMRNNVLATVSSMLKQLRGLKGKLEEAETSSDRIMQTVQRRSQHIAEQQQFFASLPSQSPLSSRIDLQVSSTNRKGDEVGSPAETHLQRRVDVMMVDYLLRQGLNSSAVALAKETNVLPLVETELFAVAKQVTEDLRGHSVAKALMWCGSHRSQLRRIDSLLEFHLRLQIFVEHIRARDILSALSYARSDLTQFLELKGTQDHLQRAMGMLAFLPRAEPQPVAMTDVGEAVEDSKEDDGEDTSGQHMRNHVDIGFGLELLDNERWEWLGNLFRRTFCEINGLTYQSTLELALFTGYTVLRTRYCAAEQKNSHHDDRCPSCNSLFQDMIPSAKLVPRLRSNLVCRISGTILDEFNPPLALPNGQVYGTAALEAMAGVDGTVVCPHTGEKFPIADCRNVYIV